MSTKIRDLSIEKTIAEDGDYFLGDDPNNGVTYKISKNNLFTGITASGNSGELLPSSNVLIANYQSDFSDLKNHAYTIIGSPSISADESPYSEGSSLYLPGNSYIEYTANADFQINSDWAVECFAWIPSAFANNNTYTGLISVTSGSLYICLALFRSGTTFNGVSKPLYAQIYSPSSNVEITLGALTSTIFDSWNHLSVRSNGGRIYFYINGFLNASANTGNQPRFTVAPKVLVGIADGLSSLSNGYIAGVRIRATSVKVPTLPFTE